MQSQSQKNSQFMITKQVFIDHIPNEIEEHYEIYPNCLGQGGFGKVFQARKRRKIDEIANIQDVLGASFSSYETSSRFEEDEQNMGELRAIKQIYFKRQEDKQLMKNQIEILSYLDHPSILKLYQTYQYKKHLYLVTDLLKGGDLFTLIDEKNDINEQQAKVVFQQLIKALKYLHSHHICHRDLKLQNIMFLDQHSLNIKLIDFGLAYCWDQDMKMELKRNRQNLKIAGTPDYMAPEVIAHRYDQRCDIWSAGVILYILLSGVAPFSGKNDKEIIKKIQNINYSLQIPEFKNISYSAKDLIQKILKPQVQRITLQQILNHEWFKQIQCGIYKNSQATSTASFSSKKRCFTQNSDKINFNFTTTRSFDRIKKKNSLNTFQNSQCQLSCHSNCQDEILHEQKTERLTVEKMEYYCNLPKLRKLFAIYAVSRLSQKKTKNFGHQFMIIDKNNDGTISLQDLAQYLFQTEQFCDKQKTQFFFHEIALSKRGFISYSQYLACVLSYQSIFRNHPNYLELQFDQKISISRKNSLFTQSLYMLQPIDIYNESDIYQFFYLLDKDGDGFISTKDFVCLFSQNGIQDMNKNFIEQISIKISELSQKKLVCCEQVEQAVEAEEWSYDPRKFKEFLSRTYKGQSDGGLFIDYKKFKHLMKNYENCLNNPFI